MAPIENASTKFALVREKAGINTGGIKYFGSRIYDQMTMQGVRQVSGFWFRKFGRTTLPDAEEITKREFFANASKWVAAAIKDLTAITNNQIQFAIVVRDHSKSCGGVYWQGEKFRGYMFKYAMKTLLDGGTLPANHQLPTAA